MNLSEVFKISGSNIGPVLSATALAVTSTMSPSPARAEGQQLTIFPGQYAMRAQSPTDVGFMLGRSLDGQREPVNTAQVPSQMIKGIDEQRATKMLLLNPAMGLGYIPHNLVTYELPLTPESSLSAGTAIQMASEFYDNVPVDARSETLWDIVSLSYAIGGPTPRVDVVDGMTTVDFSAPGHLVSILIDEDVCHLSAFSRQKELKMTYVIEKGVPRDEFVDVLWGQLRDFHRSSEA